MPCTSGFVHEVIFPHNGPRGGMSISTTAEWRYCIIIYKLDSTLYLFMTSSYLSSFLEKLPSSTHRKDRCSVVSDPVQRLWPTCGWVFLEVISSLMEACESQPQLRGDGLHLEHCVWCGQSISVIVLLPCWKAGDTLTLPWLLHLLTYMTSVRDHQDLAAL